MLIVTLSILISLTFSTVTPYVVFSSPWAFLWLSSESTCSAPWNTFHSVVIPVFFNTKNNCSLTFVDLKYLQPIFIWLLYAKYPSFWLSHIHRGMCSLTFMTSLFLHILMDWTMLIICKECWSFFMFLQKSKPERSIEHFWINSASHTLVFEERIYLYLCRERKYCYLKRLHKTWMQVQKRMWWWHPGACVLAWASVLFKVP